MKWWAYMETNFWNWELLLYLDNVNAIVCYLLSVFIITHVLLLFFAEVKWKGKIAFTQVLKGLLLGGAPG